MSRRSKSPKGKAPEDQETVFEEFRPVGTSDKGGAVRREGSGRAVRYVLILPPS